VTSRVIWPPRLDDVDDADVASRPAAAALLARLAGLEDRVQRFDAWCGDRVTAPGAGQQRALGTLILVALVAFQRGCRCDDSVRHSAAVPVSGRQPHAWFFSAAFGRNRLTR